MHCFTPEGSKDKKKKIQEQQWPQAFSLDLKKKKHKNMAFSLLQSI